MAIDFLLAAFWFFLPAALANAAPLLIAQAKLLPDLAWPIDNGRAFRGVRILGDHKTMRGYVSAVVVGIATAMLQSTLFTVWSISELPFYIDYAIKNPIIVGFLFGFGAVLGDSIESFFKRQMGINPGGTWIPFDQLDYILCAVLLSFVYIPSPLSAYVWVVGLWFAMHFITSGFWFLLGRRDKPW